MKSISIVYKRPKTYQEPNPMTKSDSRTSVNNDYFTCLIEKGVNKQQVLQKIRSRTARAVQLRDRKNIISSLSIATLSNPQPILLKSQTSRKVPATSPLLQVKRSQPAADLLFTLKLHSNINNQTQQSLSPMPYRIPLKDSAFKHAQVKLLTNKIKCQKQATLIISADFIYNQYNFWADQQIEETSVKVWKMLSTLANIVWLVKRQSTFKKFAQFTDAKGLRLDGVLQVLPNKKQSLTISYSNFQNEVKLNRNHKLVILNALKASNSMPIGSQNKQLSQFQFRASLPVISHHSTSVHFVRIDMSNKHRFSAIKKVVSQELPAPYDLRPIFREHDEKKYKGLIKIWKARDQALQLKQMQVSKYNVLAEIQRIKGNLLPYFQQAFGLRTRLDGDSLTYIIGDMLKRNYNIFKQYYKYCEQKSQPQQNIQSFCRQSIVTGKLKRLDYNRKIYIWQP